MGISKVLLKHIRIVKTWNLYLTFFVLGLFLSVVGPCVLDLQRLVNIGTWHIYLIFTGKSIGMLIGSLIGGILFDIVKSNQAVLTVCCILFTGTTLAIPWSKNFGTLLGCMTLNGLWIGLIENGSIVLCLKLWGKQSGPFLQGLHFISGVGGLIAPLIAAPYLEDYYLDISTGNNDTSLNETFLNASSKHYVTFNISAPLGASVPGIIYPFFIIAVLTAFLTTLLLVVCILSPTEEGIKDSDKMDNSKRSWKFMFTVIGFNCFLIFIITGIELAYQQLITSYAVKGHLHLHTSTGSYITSSFWAAFTVSRLISVFIAMRFKSLVLITGDMIMITVAAILLLFLMSNEWALWLASITFGAGIGSFCPTVLVWMNEHVYVTNKIVAIITFGSSAGEILIPFLISYYLDSIPETFDYVIAISCVLSIVIVFILYIFFKIFDKKVEICVNSAISANN